MLFDLSSALRGQTALGRGSLSIAAMALVIKPDKTLSCVHFASNAPRLNATDRAIAIPAQLCAQRWERWSAQAACYGRTIRIPNLKCKHMRKRLSAAKPRPAWATDRKPVVPISIILHLTWPGGS